VRLTPPIANTVAITAKPLLIFLIGVALLFRDGRTLPVTCYLDRSCHRSLSPAGKVVPSCGNGRGLPHPVTHWLCRIAAESPILGAWKLRRTF
ncbi:MAG TPA: hypothetical protein VFN42_13420, partial [Acetobacteraceae bacterium]|nr:hypothetical protein [Acetobacteraceae bacterium]